MYLHLSPALKITKEQSVFGITDASGLKQNQKDLFLFFLKLSTGTATSNHPPVSSLDIYFWLQNNHITIFFSKYSSWEKCVLGIAVGIIGFEKYTIKSFEKSFTLFFSQMGKGYL